MLSYKMDFSSCDIMPGFGKSSHIYVYNNIIHMHDIYVYDVEISATRNEVHVARFGNGEYRYITRTFCELHDFALSRNNYLNIISHNNDAWTIYGFKSMY